MADFLRLSMFATTLNVRGSLPAGVTDAFQLSPVPFENQFQVNFTLLTAGAVTVELFDEMGRKVQTVVADHQYTTGAHVLLVNGAHLKAGLYVATVTIDGQVISKKTIKL